MIKVVVFCNIIYKRGEWDWNIRTVYKDEFFGIF